MNAVVSLCSFLQNIWRVLFASVLSWAPEKKKQFWFIDLQIENRKLYFRERAQAKCETWDYFDHIPGGGDKKVVYLTNVYWTVLTSYTRIQYRAVDTRLC